MTDVNASQEAPDVLEVKIESASVPDDVASCAGMLLEPEDRQFEVDPNFFSADLRFDPLKSFNY